MVLTTVSVSLAATTIQIGQTTTASVSGKDQNGGTIATGVVTWSASATTIATVDASGSITALAAGQTTITATAGAKSGQATLTVVPVPVGTVTVSPDATSLVVGTRTLLTAVTKDASGNTLTGRTVTWSSSGATIASLASPNAGGLVTAVAAGAALITATSEGKSGTATVTVTAAGPTPVCTGTPQLGCGLGADQFALIPAGSFQMGSTAIPANAWSEQPVHSVTLSRAFYLQKTEITMAQWRAVMGYDQSAFLSCGDTCPANDMSWDLIQTFISWLRASTGIRYRLPTEAEWEYAARAGTTDERYGPLDAVAWYYYNSAPQTHAVAGKQANAWGLYDMLGNVEEWVNDWYGPYASGAVTDPTGATDGTFRVLRGGSWPRSWIDARAAFRGRNVPWDGVSISGFRLATSSLDPAAVASVTVTPGSATLTVGQRLQLTAALKDADDVALNGRTVTWSSSNASVATVSSAGFVAAVAAGSATISATSEGVTGTAAITSSPAAVATVSIAPSAVSIAVDATQQLTATLRDAGGNTLTGRLITWSSSNGGVATVNSATGVVTGAGAGTATITATNVNKAGAASVTVTAANCSSATQLGCGFGSEQFALIPAGTFRMGSLRFTYGDHAVTLTRPFYMQRTEVTQAQWRAVMGTNPSRHATCGDACPVETVSWNDVQSFIQQLSASSGATYRLATDAEWEYAARAGSTGETYGELDAIAWYVGNSALRSHPVASKQPNAWGLYDMLGNTTEWVNDWYSGSFSSAPTTDPTGPATGTYRMTRGSSWSDSGPFTTLSYPSYDGPTNRWNFLGFRLVRVP